MTTTPCACPTRPRSSSSLTTSAQSTHIRVVDGREIPIPGRWAVALEAGAFLAGKGVKIEIDAEAVRDDGNH